MPWTGTASAFTNFNNGGSETKALGTVDVVDAPAAAAAVLVVVGEMVYMYALLLLLFSLRLLYDMIVSSYRNAERSALIA